MRSRIFSSKPVKQYFSTQKHNKEKRRFKIKIDKVSRAAKNSACPFARNTSAKKVEEGRQAI